VIVAVAPGFANRLLSVPVAALGRGSLRLAKTSSGTVLLGGEAEYHLAPTNPTSSGVEQYNLSYVVRTNRSA
jgi:hypothetical protein